MPLRREECDWAADRDLLYELPQRFNASEELDRRCEVLGRTAPHLATQAGNTGVVSELLAMGADATLLDEGGEAAAQLAARLLRDGYAAEHGITTEIKEMLQLPRGVEVTT